MPSRLRQSLPRGCVRAHDRRWSPCREFVMANKMLIDSSHPEETRVVVVRGSKVEEFDFESANRRPLRGNIYLAKVIRVEPSLQAAFVDYGGNRHGFLAFSEIHPDYYQIPVADRQALLRADAEAAEAEDEEDEEERSGRRRNRGRKGKNRHRDEDRKPAHAEAGGADENNNGESQAEGGEQLAEIEPFESTGFLSNSFVSSVSDNSDEETAEASSSEGDASTDAPAAEQNEVTEDNKAS